MPSKTDFDSRPWLKILVHTDSIADIHQISAFLELNLTEYIEIDVTPTKDTELIKILTQNKIDVPEYYIEDDHIAMRYHNGFKNAQSYSNRYDRIFSKYQSSVSNEDLLMSRRYDFFIIDESDPLHNEKTLSNLATFCSVKKYLRIIFSNRGIFLHLHNQHLGEGWYYQIRANKIFKCCKEYWSISVRLKDKYPSINRSMGSLWIRFNFLLRAYEKVAYYALDLGHDDSHNNVLYHLGFFILLCTGAFDELAWIANDLYGFKLDKRKVGLRQPDFHKKLRRYKSAIADLLLEDKFMNMVNSFYPIRDSLQHRNYLSSYSLSSEGGSSQMIYLDEASASLLMPYVKLREMTSHENNEEKIQYSIHPGVLIEHLMDSFTEIITRYVEALNWDDLKTQLSETDLKAVEASLEENDREIELYTKDTMYI